MPSKAAELRELPDDELVVRMDAAKEELFNLRFQLATGQLDNPMRIKDVRHDVARILTILRERELGLELEAEPEADRVPDVAGGEEEGSGGEAAAPEGAAKRRRLRREPKEQNQQEGSSSEAVAPGDDSAKRRRRGQEEER